MSVKKIYITCLIALYSFCNHLFANNLQENVISKKDSMHNSNINSSDTIPYKMPDEAAKHRATFMSVQVDENIWGKRLALATKKTLINIAETIAKKDMDITDGHTDFYARFVKPGVIVVAIENDEKQFDYEVTRKNVEILKNATDAQNRKLSVHILPSPKKLRSTYLTKDFAAGYINFYVINGAVLLPEFGDKTTDSYAKNTLQELFPDRDIIQLNIDPIAAGGGGIHCSTQQIPLVE